MTIYTFKKRQFIQSNMENIWEYISTPVNLSSITPPEMNFSIISNTGSESVTYPGQIIQYRVNVFPKIRVRWVTEITHIKEGEYFVDEQRFGPYSFWHHQHILRPVNNGVEMEDIVSYGLPFGILGKMMNRFFISGQLNRIFEYRENILDKHFNKT